MRPTMIALMMAAHQLLFSATAGEIIQDPMADYLSLKMTNRDYNLFDYENIARATLDIDGDGTDEIFIGAFFNRETYWSIYQKVEQGFVRLTPEWEEFAITLLPYRGFVKSEGKKGLLTQGRFRKSTPTRLGGVSTLSFVTLIDGKLEQKILPGLDFNKPEDEKLYEEYFGEGKRPPVNAENLTRSDLESQGYTVPKMKEYPDPAEVSPPVPKETVRHSPKKAEIPPPQDMKAAPIAKSPVDAPDRRWLWILVGILLVLGCCWALIKKRQ